MTKNRLYKAKKKENHTPSDEGIHFEFNIITGESLYDQHVEVQACKGTTHRNS